MFVDSVTRCFAEIAMVAVYFIVSFFSNIVFVTIDGCQFMLFCQEDVSKWDTAEKMVQEQLNEVVTEADSLTKRRDDLALEKRKIDRNMHELGVKISNILSQLREKKEEKEMLETTRDNFVAM